MSLSPEQIGEVCRRVIERARAEKGLEPVSPEQAERDKATALAAEIRGRGY